MAKKTKPSILQEDVDMAAQNQKTIEMKPNKALQMSQAITLLQSMSGDEINNLLQTLQQNSQSAAASIPNDAAAKNAASIAMKGAISEEMNEIFGGEELTEEFKEKITTLFEAAVSAKVAVELTEMEEKFNTQLEEQSTQIAEELTDQVDKYLSYVAEEWVKENELAIEKSIRTQLAENFIIGLKELFDSHHINIPEDKVDVVEALTLKHDELVEQLNKVTVEKLELENALTEAVMEEVFNNTSSGLAMTEVAKFRTLAEGIEFNGDVDGYTKKLNIIKEKYFGKKTLTSKNSEKALVTELAEETSDDVTDSIVEKYAEAIAKAAKN